MEKVTKKTVTNLTVESVSILTQQFEVETVTEIRYETQTETKYETQIQEQDGEMVEVQAPVEVEVQVPVEVEVEKETQVGSNHRRAYSNSKSGRTELVANEPEEVVTEVLMVWGDEPTVKEVGISGYAPKPTAEERIAVLEAENEQLKAEIEMQAEVLDYLLMQ